MCGKVYVGQDDGIRGRRLAWALIDARWNSATPNEPILAESKKTDT